MTIDARVEMFYSNTWNTVTGDVDMDGGIAIGSGQPDEHSESDPTSCALTLEDRGGAYRPLDPTSALFGLIGHGTPLRVRIGSAQPRLVLNGVGVGTVGGTDGSYASTPDHVSLDIIGDIDVRMELQPPTWRPLRVTVLAGKYIDFSNQKSWAVRLLTTGTLELAWTTDGTSGTRVVRQSTAAVPDDGARRAVRVTLDVDNGAVGHDVTFYTSTAIGGTWTQLGSVVTTAGTTSIFSSTAHLTVGSLHDGRKEFSSEVQLAGRVFAFEVRNGIAGTVVANPNFTIREPDHTLFIDGAGRVWAVHESASIVDVSLRSYGEAISWTPQTDETTLDVRQAVDSRGILERLGAGDEPLRSTLHRVTAALDVNAPVAYWPCEDGVNATQLAAGIDGVSPMPTAAPSTELFDGFVCSDPIPVLNNDSRWVGVVPPYSGTDIQVRMLLHLPEGGISVEKTLFILHTTGTAAKWNLNVLPAGTVRLLAYAADGTNLLDSGVLTMNGLAGNDKLDRLQLTLEQVGADITWDVTKYTQDAAEIGGSSGTLAGRTCDTVQQITVSPFAGLGGVAVGHVIIQPAVTDLFDVVDELNAFHGEASGRRIQRLCAEEGIPFEHIGDLDATAAMGRQRPGQLMDLIEECWVADLGMVYEPRRSALGYRTHGSLANQSPALVLDMAAGVVVNPFAPPLDATRVRNDITVTRRDGSSARAVRETGPASVASVGRRKDSFTLNVRGDDQLADQAWWRLHVGTFLGHRISVLEVEMEHHPELQLAVLQLRQGDLIRLTNPLPGLPPGPIDLLALGWTDTITDQTWHWACHCAPAAPYQTVVLDGATLGKLDSETSTLASGVTSAATSLSVATTQQGSAPLTLWTTAPAEMPFGITIGGEDMTVTAISGASSPQTFTVTRNPVTAKAHSAGASVRLTRRSVIAL